jgi:S1-C subfamily serine protease
VRDAALGEQLAVGDVVTTVNGRRIEREGEFYEVFMGMAFARELTVATVRAGQARAISLPIDDDPNAPPIPLSPASSAAAAPTKAKKQR